MNPELQRMFRINLLLQARAGSRMGLTVSELTLGAHTQGFREATRESVREETQYLIDKGHLARVNADISPDVENFRLTAAGRDWLTQQDA